MANHGIVRTDNMHGTVFGADLVSVRVATAIDNGNFCVPGAYETGAREVRAAATPAANSALASLVLVASEEVITDKKYDTLADFYNEVGTIARGYKLNVGDMFSLSADAFETKSGVTATVGTSILEAQAKTKGLLVNSATSGSTKIADLVAIETEGDITWYVFRV